MIKELKERLTEVNYVYVALPTQGVIAEFTDEKMAHAYAKTFNGVFWDHFPYAEYGFEDPYTFTNTWVVLETSGEIVEYDWVGDALTEVLK